MIHSGLWNNLSGRELDTTPLAEQARARRVVACLNVWNDLQSLQRSIGTWRSYVDHVIAIDGCYDTIGNEVSRDGTREFLRDTFDSIEIIDLPGVSQCAKRTEYFDHGRDGDYMFVVDADEHVLNGRVLCELPRCDVGWVRIQSPLYQRQYGQPRIFRWRPGLNYRGRHHWLYENHLLVATHQYGGPGYAHRSVGLVMQNVRDVARTGERKSAKRDNFFKQQEVEAPLSATPRSVLSDSKIGAREALWILNYAYRDDGIAPSRFHSAINRTTPHTSMFFKTRPGPFGVTTQYDAVKDGGRLVQAANLADVIHIHTVVSLAHRVNIPKPHVFHHHGSILRANADKYEQEAKRKNALVLVSNLELLSWTGDHPAFFLPNVVPFARYNQLAQENRKFYDGNNPFRICHSPTHAERKGTKQFLQACHTLMERGLPIEPVLIENRTHADSLFIKSTCHAAFDSFWLGMQCSGLECAAMGMPVIAGDPIVRDRYVAQFGQCPYTFANDQESLEAEITALVESEDYRLHEADRVSEYVMANHDESSVGLTYLDYLDQAFHWRELKKKNGKLHPTSQLRREVAPR